MQLLGGNPHLAAQAELPAVGEAGGGVPVDGGAVHPGQEGVGRSLVAGDNGLGVSGGVGSDVAHGLLQAVHHPDGQDVVQKFGVKVGGPGGGAVDDFGRFRVQPQLHRVAKAVVLQPVLQLG